MTDWSTIGKKLFPDEKILTKEAVLTKLQEMVVNNFQVYRDYISSQITGGSGSSVEMFYNRHTGELMPEGKDGAGSIILAAGGRGEHLVRYNLLDPGETRKSFGLLEELKDRTHGHPQTATLLGAMYSLALSGSCNNILNQ